jgi:hypothetical protein
MGWRSASVFSSGVLLRDPGVELDIRANRLPESRYREDLRVEDLLEAVQRLIASRMS